MAGVHTEYFPALAKTLTVVCVDYVCHSMAIIIVPMPDISYTALAAQVPELEDGGWERYLAHCNFIRWFVRDGSEGGTHCSAQLLDLFYLGIILVFRYTAF